MHSNHITDYAAARPEAVAAKHEVEDLALGGIKGFAIFLGLMLLVTFIIVWIVIRLLLAQSVASDQVVSPFAGTNHPIPPEPQLEPSRYHNTLDWQDLQGLRDGEKKKLTEFAWIGDQKQKARIPIEKAMDMVLAAGLPTRQGPASDAPAALPAGGGAGGLMVAPANPLTLPPGNATPGNRVETPP